MRRLVPILAIAAIGAGLTGMALAAGSGGGPGWGPDWHGPMMGLGGASGVEHLEATPPPIAGAPTVSVTADEFRFEPSVMRLPQNGPVNIEVTNNGNIHHDLVVEGLGIHVGAGPGDTVVAGFDSLPPGEYPVVCTVPGHAAHGMVATLKVGA